MRCTLLSYSDNIAFKGGTSLSKCWNLIERFSEDIDICMNREYLGFHGELSKTQISDKLRRAACSFVREHMQNDLRSALVSLGISLDLFDVNVEITPISTTDPETITVSYNSLFDKSPYIRNTVKVEVSGRAMMEPTEQCAICSEIDSHFPSALFAEEKFQVNAVIPERTFLEKVFLLHEEFQKENVRVERMSRHIYDLAMMMDFGIDEKALHNQKLYRDVLEHRRKFIGLKGFDYDELYPTNICIIPNGHIRDLWEKDYLFMCEHMIYGTPPLFDTLLKKLAQLNDKIKKLGYGKS